MAKRKKTPAKAKPVNPSTRNFTYLLPVYLKLQLTFRGSEVRRPDDDEPEITAKALRAMEKELKEYLGLNYYVDDLKLIDDGIESVFLGES